MTGDQVRDGEVRGSLRSAEGAGIVSLEARIGSDVGEVWAALTDPRRLARWLGEVEGEFCRGGALRAHYVASGWEGTLRVEACEPPRRLLVRTTSPEEPDGVVEVRLSADGAGAMLVLEDRGLPLDRIAAYGAGDQIHVEDLAAHLAGRPRCDARARWRELHPGYQGLAAGLVAL